MAVMLTLNIVASINNATNRGWTITFRGNERELILCTEIVTRHGRKFYSERTISRSAADDPNLLSYEIDFATDERRIPEISDAIRERTERDPMAPDTLAFG